MEITLLVGWTTADTLPTKWTHVNHRSRYVRQPKTDVLTTEPRHYIHISILCVQKNYILQTILVPGMRKQEDLAICLRHLSQATLRSGDDSFGFNLSRSATTSLSSVADTMSTNVRRKFGSTCIITTWKSTHLHDFPATWKKVNKGKCKVHLYSTTIATYVVSAGCRHREGQRTA